MRIVFFTSARFTSNEVFSYTFANVANSFNDVYIVAVRRTVDRSPKGYLRKLKRVWRFGTGTINAIELVSSYPLQKYLIKRDERQAQAGMRALTRPLIRPQPERTTFVDSVNGHDAVQTITSLEPDIVIQIDAGILKKPIFEIARIGTLNMHPGIAPLIKGRDSIYWALWYREPRWLGATIHFIDEGIDTGSVLAYAPVRLLFPRESYPSLFVRIHEAGVSKLIDTLFRLAGGERWAIEPPQGERLYRSTISGWKLFLLRLQGALR